MKYLISILAIAALSLPASAAQEEYYIWVDENGVTNYSQRNPQGIEAQYVGPNQPEESGRSQGQRPGGVEPEPEPEGQGQQSADASDAQPDGNAGQDGDVDPDELIEEEREAIASQIAETKRENCDIAKKNLAQLTAYSRIRVAGDDGEERVLSEEERQSRISEARQNVRDNCTG